MAKAKQNGSVELGGVTYSEQELQTMFREAKQRGRESLRRNPTATSAKYDHRTRRVILSLSNQTEFLVPIDLLQGLQSATPAQLTPAQLKDVIVMPVGTAIEWPQLDQQFSVTGLLAGVFGGKAWMLKLHSGNRSPASSQRRLAKPRIKRLHKTKAGMFV